MDQGSRKGMVLNLEMPLCTTKDSTSKQQSTQKIGEQASGSRLKIGDGSKSGNASLCTTKSATSKQWSTQKRGARTSWRIYRLMKADGSTSGTKSGSFELHFHRLKRVGMLNCVTVALPGKKAVTVASSYSS